MLKLIMWSNHIPVSQFFSSNLDLKENKISLSRASARPLWISTQDQPETTLLNLIFFSKKISLLIWTKPESWSTLWSFLWPSSSLLLLLFFLRLCCYYKVETSTRGDAQQPWIWKEGRLKGGGVWTSEEKRGEEKRRRGALLKGMGLPVEVA